MKKSMRLGAIAGSFTFALILAGNTLAASSLTNLGPPTNAVSTANYFPLSGFHRIGTSLHANSRPEALWIGTEMQVGNSLLDGTSAIERWAVIKALNQFGTFSSIHAASAMCFSDAAVGHNVCHLPTFDWTHARYQSRYVTFVHKDLLNAVGHPLQRLSPAELALYNRYSRVRGPAKSDPYDAGNTVLTNEENSRKLPLVLVGNYLQTVSQVMSEGDFEESLASSSPTGSAVPSGLPFNTVHKTLVSGKDSAGSHLVMDVNAEANIITALICHADGKKPASVCTRPVIKTILKQVK